MLPMKQTGCFEPDTAFELIMDEWFSYLVVGTLGALIGSFLNVCIFRLPRGESIVWYEGDTLVVDTIGQNNKTVVDRFGTPHSDKLRVVERWRVIDQGLTLRVDIEVTDPDTFYQPWKTYQLYRRTNGPLVEEICAENNTPLFDYGTPTDTTPDF